LERARKALSKIHPLHKVIVYTEIPSITKKITIAELNQIRQPTTRKEEETRSSKNKLPTMLTKEQSNHPINEEPTLSRKEQKLRQNNQLSNQLLLQKNINNCK